MNRRPSSFAAALVLSILPGCANVPPDVDFGRAVATAREQQRLNPNPKPLSNEARAMDGAGAAESVQRYRDSFKAPPPTFVIFGSEGSAR